MASPPKIHVADPSNPTKTLCDYDGIKGVPFDDWWRAYEKQCVFCRDVLERIAKQRK